MKLEKRELQMHPAASSTSLLGIIFLKKYSCCALTNLKQSGALSGQQRISANMVHVSVLVPVDANNVEAAVKEFGVDAVTNSKRIHSLTCCAHNQQSGEDDSFISLER